MNCPACRSGTRVLDTRGALRRRECPTCGIRFTTTEVCGARRDRAAAKRLGNARKTLVALGYLQEKSYE